MIAILVNGPANGREVAVGDNVHTVAVPLAPDWDKARYVRTVCDDDGYAFFEYTGTEKTGVSSEVAQ